MANSTDNREFNCRWPITIGCAVVFALIGLAIGWSIDTKHPDDRTADLMIPTLIFLTAGLLIGYVSSLVIYKRLTWFDALAAFSVPPICFFGFLSAKSGNWTTGQSFGYTAVAIVAFLVFRFYQTSQQLTDSNELRPVQNPGAKNDG